jgi:KDO2-lipid IV(A) lauroyltransferase
MVTILFILGRLPVTLGRWLVAPLGPLMLVLMGRRREIAKRNIAACFPDWSEARRRKLLRGSFSSLARTLVEMAWLWTDGGRKVLSMGEIHGIENMEAAVSRGGVLMVTAHFTSLEVGGRLLCDKFTGGGLYRPLSNEVMEWYQTRGRLAWADVMISKRNIRAAIRHLRTPDNLWYAPDQDFGPSQSVFAPFFGIPTASLVATHKIPSMTGCSVVPMYPRYDRKRKVYEVYVGPALEDFPTDDVTADLARINAILEEQVRQVPDQYWWIHRRFKTRPEGEPGFYD